MHRHCTRAVSADAELRCPDSQIVRVFGRKVVLTLTDLETLVE